MLATSVLIALVALAGGSCARGEDGAGESTVEDGPTGVAEVPEPSEAAGTLSETDEQVPEDDQQQEHDAVLGAERSKATNVPSGIYGPDEDERAEEDDGLAPLAGRVIALDPGHNGGNFDAPEETNRPVDAGGLTKPCNTTGTATRDGYRESTFNLEVALLIRDRLERHGAEVHLTREGDDGVGPCIDERGRFGARVGADLLVSIHADGGPPAGRGFHVIRPSGRPGTDLSIVEPSLELASHLRDALYDAGFTPSTYVGVDGMVARDDLGTLNLSSVPAVLVEAGNLRNRDDAVLLSDPEGQARIADAITDGVLGYLTP